MITKAIEQILADPCASYWLKNAFRSAVQRDCVDAAKDAETLHLLLDDRCAKILNTPAEDHRHAALCGCGAEATHLTRHGSPVCHTCADGTEQLQARATRTPYRTPRRIDYV